MYYRLNRLLYEEPQFVPITLEDVTATDVLWGQGLLYTGTVPTPLRASLAPSSGNVMPDLDLGMPPIISKRLTDAIARAGVDNLQLFDIEISDPRNGAVYHDHLAMNVIGVVSCADLDASEYRSGAVPRLNFTKLVIDEQRAAHLPLFRLAESLRYILISQQVRDVLVSLPLVGVRISSLDDPDAYVG